MGAEMAAAVLFVIPEGGFGRKLRGGEKKRTEGRGGEGAKC